MNTKTSKGVRGPRGAQGASLFRRIANAKWYVRLNAFLSYRIALKQKLAAQAEYINELQKENEQLAESNKTLAAALHKAKGKTSGTYGAVEEDHAESA